MKWDIYKFPKRINIFLQFFRTFMEILRKLKSTEAINAEAGSGLIHCLQIQLLGLFLLKQNMPLYHSILKIQQILSQAVIQALVIINLAINLTAVLCLVIQLMCNVKTISFINTFNMALFKIIKLSPYVAFIQIININTQLLKKIQIHLVIFAVFNISIIVGQIILLKYINISYRFQDSNFLKRKNTSVITWILIVLIIGILNFTDPLYAVFILGFRSVVQLYFNFCNFENQVIRRLQYFYPFLTFIFISSIVSDKFLAISVFQSTINFTFLIGFSVYTSNSLAQCLVLKSLRYHLKKNQHKFQLQNEITNLQSEDAKELDDDQKEKFMLFLRIIVKVYVTRTQFQIDKDFQDQVEPVNNYNTWWSIFNLTTLKHKVQCCEVTCLCKKFEGGSLQNSNIQNKIFLQTASSLLVGMIQNLVAKDYKIPIIQKYFIIQFEKKPLKAHFELIKLYKKSLKIEERLEVEEIMKQTKQNFQQVFLTQKVQNQHLQIQPIIQFQNKIKDMKAQMMQLSVNYKKYYEIFSNSLVQMDLLKRYALILSKIKKGLNNQIDTYLVKFDRNLEFLTFCLTYYRFFDEYTGKQSAIQKKAQFLIQNLTNPYKLRNRDQVDIFDPFYGSIKIGLVFHPGKIAGITKNICHMLGYKIQDVIGHKINRVMPYMFARYHDRFLRKFIQNGSFNMLKCKERIFYARTASKFIVPITVRIKVEYLSVQNFYASSLIHKTQTKSQFVLMNNHGRIQQISQNLYNLLFKQTFKDQIPKLKKLCMYKMLLSLNHLLKQLSENDDTVHEGIIITSDHQDVLFSFFRSMDILRHLDKPQGQQQASSRSSEHSSLLRSKSTLDITEDQEKFDNELKESFRDYFKKIQLQKVRAYRITFRFSQIITSQFKCKLLQILFIKQELQAYTIQEQVSQQLAGVGQLYGLEQQTRKFRNQLQSCADNLHTQRLDFQTTTQNMLKQNRGFGNKRSKTLTRNNLQTVQIDDSSIGSVDNYITHGNLKTLNNIGMEFHQSDTSSTLEIKQELNEKSSLIAAFQIKDFIDYNAQIMIGVLIFLLISTLIIICVFSMTLQGDYDGLRKDNLIVSNIRLNFQFRLAIQQLQHFYHPFNLTPPSFIKEKKKVLTDNLKDLLKNSMTWIGSSISGSLYSDIINFFDVDTGFKERRQIMFTINRIYSMFLMSENQAQYLSDNYVQLDSHFNDLAKKQSDIILTQSQNLSIKIHVVVGLYLFFLVCLALVYGYVNKQNLVKENKATDFLPFVNVKLTSKRAEFYQKVFEYVKQSQTVYFQDIQQIQFSKDIVKNQKKDLNAIGLKNTKKKNEHLQNALKLLQKNEKQSSSSSRLIKIVKSDSTIFSKKSLLVYFAIICLCMAVVIQSQVLFSQTQDKFQTYITLKETAMMIQNIPPRLMLIYFINFDLMLRAQPPIQFPDSFYVLAHDQGYKLRNNISQVYFNNTQMAIIINRHVTSLICNIVTCDPNNTAVQNQQVAFLAYRFTNAFDYIRLIKDFLPKKTDLKEQLLKWINQNKIVELLDSVEYILELMKINQILISSLFDKEIQQIGNILLIVSLTLIPFLIFVMLFIRKKFIEFVTHRLETTQSIYRHFSWTILSDNSYAVNYFQEKIKNVKYK